MPVDLYLDILGAPFFITVDEDPAYLDRLLVNYRNAVDDVRKSTGLKDKDALKIAILTGFSLCDELEKLKVIIEKGGEEEQKTLQRTLNLFSRLDEAMEKLKLPDMSENAKIPISPSGSVPVSLPLLYKLQNTVKHYEWGSPVHIPALLGADNSQAAPWAELWMGVHPGGPSRIAGNKTVTNNPANAPQAGELSLRDLIAANPERYVGRSAAKSFGGLPFLFKLLAAAKPLSIQAHPNLGQAREGWRRENEKGIPLEAPNRNYKDNCHKPEILCALNPFTAMCGFRPPEEIDSLLAKHFDGAPRSLREGIGLLQTALNGKDPLKGFLEALFRLSPETLGELTVYARETALPDGEWDLVSRFAGLYPGDPGIIAPLYLNLLQLMPGEAVYLPAGVLHAYVHGFAVELMANSDNVLRGGLSSKHVDVEELLSILDFNPYRPKILKAQPAGNGLSRYDTPCREFSLQVMKSRGGTVFFPEMGPAIVVVTEGKLRVSPGDDKKLQGENWTLARGESAFIPARGKDAPDKTGPGLPGNLAFSGAYTIYIASLPLEEGSSPNLS
ncbi:MAG: mannose-6-phosphate isomerase, class I [Treponema sp.]|jgi:mannose-6-phosphate isomerase|nr:mannose-6-phosphate isomerase, class I [Treponema sp.]